ncbi:MAG TPA: hypothetical protein VL949_10870 [Geobacteraceae bacterium]|jgi:hypothetical protein|nr:hypothetical protein [Geobacteraceae bacterium]
MRRTTVGSGLKLIIGGVVAVILASFFHDQLATLLFLSPAGETELIFLGLFWGGVLGFCGILVTVIGFLRASGGERRINLLRSVIALIMVVLLFFILLFATFRNPEPRRLRPGETITI